MSRELAHRSWAKPGIHHSKHFERGPALLNVGTGATGGLQTQRPSPGTFHLPTRDQISPPVATTAHQRGGSPRHGPHARWQAVRASKAPGPCSIPPWRVDFTLANFFYYPLSVISGFQNLWLLLGLALDLPSSARTSFLWVSVSTRGVPTNFNHGQGLFGQLKMVGSTMKQLFLAASG